MKVVLQVESHCWGWNGSSWYTHHDDTHDFVVDFRDLNIVRFGKYFETKMPP
jgi:hypothetical protein